MNERIKELFEKHTVPNFGPVDGRPHKNVNGEYHNPVIEDHWQTFQEAAELIVRECAEVGSYGHGCIDSELIKRGILEHFGVEALEK